MDPFEQNILSLLQSRREVASRIVATRVREEPIETEESVQDRIPYSISQTIQYLKADEYQRTQKALKKQKETI